jgi:hypothetical protein
MIDIHFFILMVSIILLFPVLMKFRLLLGGHLKPEDFFSKGKFFSIKVEKTVTVIGIILFIFSILLMYS